MSSLPQLIDSTGRLFPIERQLASGGEGTVFALSKDANTVAKVYHKPPTVQTIEKLTVMVGLANPNLLGVAAWPNRLLFWPRTGQVAGFLMPRINECQPIQHLYNPVMRAKHFPRAGWRFQVRAALNAAAAFDEVHKAGCLIGDVNQSNVLVSANALVRLIDCDSFQVRANGRQYLCEVGVPHYTPPELQGRSFRGLVRTENHDRFGLAVLIYQLLFVGRHPYMGVYSGKGDPSFEELITQYRFAQGPMAHNWHMAPPPYIPTFADIPPDVNLLFRRSFERGNQERRPTPEEWLSALRSLEKQTLECATDPGHTYWRGQSKCVWCRLADKGGPEYYFGVADTSVGFEVDEMRLQAVLGRLIAHQCEEFPFLLNLYRTAKEPEPKPLPDGLDEHRTTSIIIAVALGFCVLLMPLGLYRGFISIIGLLGAIVFGVWLGVQRFLSPWGREHERRRRRKTIAADTVNSLKDEWLKTVRRYRREHEDISRFIRKSVSMCRRLAFEYREEFLRLSAHAEAVARERYLRLHSIFDANIERVGLRRKQTLVSYGIHTAADVEWKKIRNIPGFKEVLTQNIVAWRDEVSRRFRFDPKVAVSPADQRAIAVRFRIRQNQLLEEIERELDALQRLAPDYRIILSKLEVNLRKAVTGLEQASADLRLIRTGA
ncbi:MAG: hypothetical protein MUF18_12080 [Fimbriiglobus sp.]|jgi:DNA-binding helix-hairpin-helix protein with protein kinase domain|nr:hypothetical protein [Fimbriiglobus sp.]